MTDLTFDENEFLATAKEAAAAADAAMADPTMNLDLSTADLTNLPDASAPGVADLVSAVAADAAAVAPEVPAEPAPAPVAPVKIKASTIRPGMMVNLKTSITGNVSYNKETIEPETTTDDGKQREKWQTERTVAAPKEFEEATKIRNAARQKIAGICVQTAFGLLCPEDKTDQLGGAVAEAQALAEEFNGRATTTRIGIYVIAGRVAPDDLQAVRAINSEVRDLIQTMETGLQNLDVKKVRDAADKARNLGAMLSPQAAERVKAAVEVARKAARDIKKAAEVGTAEIDLVSIRKLTESRTSFLDMNEHAEIEAPVHEARAIDLAPVEGDPAAFEEQASIAPAAEPEIESIAPAVTVPQFEME